MTTKCEHTRFTWFDDDDQMRQDGKNAVTKKMGGNGHWECLDCGTVAKTSPTHDNYCSGCGKPTDNHSLVSALILCPGTDQDIARTPRKKEEK